MIRYALRCARGHAFESWFQDSASYDRQAKRGLVTCPVCNSAKVEKSIMAPRIARTGRGAARRTGREMSPAAAGPDPAVAQNAAAAPAVLPEPMLAAQVPELRARLKELRDHIKAHAENVGETFPEQARKMHYGEIAHRPIYGDASPAEAKALIEEGVEVLPLPMLPDDRN